MAKCRSCGATIWWVKTTRGKAMPIDPVETTEGNINLCEGVAHVLGPIEQEPGKAYYTSHFATCPHAARHRKGGAS